MISEVTAEKKHYWEEAGFSSEVDLRRAVLRKFKRDYLLGGGYKIVGKGIRMRCHAFALVYDVVNMLNGSIGLLSDHAGKQYFTPYMFEDDQWVIDGERTYCDHPRILEKDSLGGLALESVSNLSLIDRTLMPAYNSLVSLVGKLIGKN